MAFCRVMLPLLVLSVVHTYATVEVPVFLWGDLGERFFKQSALSAVPSNEFRVILKQELQEDPFTVVFIEETLSAEDLSSKVDGETSFTYLQANVDDAIYLPLVESPLRVLNKWVNPENVEHVQLTDSDLSADITREGVKFLFINLKDAREGESREELLRRHNDFMEDMFTKLQRRYNKVVGIYTAHYPSWTVVEHSRVRRQAETETEPNPRAVTDLSFSGLRIYFSNVLLDTSTASGPLGNAVAAPSSVNDTEMHSTIQFSNDTAVTLNIFNKGGYWILETVDLVQSSQGVDEELVPTGEGIYALLDFSYRCAVNVSFTTRNTSNTYFFTFQNLRMQPYFVNNDTNLEFGDMFNCVGFFTVPIWAGLFVVAILLSITFYGIMMMMDIKTMDRFDDPKGKTIFVNSE